jgi:hypothetical protein
VRKITRSGREARMASNDSEVAASVFTRNGPKVISRSAQAAPSTPRHRDVHRRAAAALSGQGPRLDRSRINDLLHEFDRVGQQAHQDGDKGDGLRLVQWGQGYKDGGPFFAALGLPDRLIDFVPSLLNQAIQYYSCFISYSSRDQDFADRIHQDLQDKAIRFIAVSAARSPHERIQTLGAL